MAIHSTFVLAPMMMDIGSARGKIVLPCCLIVELKTLLLIIYSCQNEQLITVT
jgi:hypothetical protein